MSRSNVRSLILLAPLIGGFAFLAAACGSSSPEQQVLTNFFRASRFRDNTTLANLSAVSFDPRTEGSVEDFEIANVGEEQRRTLQIKQLIDEEEQARQADVEFAKKKKEYQDANLEIIERVVKAERSGQKLRGRDAEVQAAWTKWRDDQAQYSKRLSAAKSKLANERAMAEISLTRPGQPTTDVSGMDVELVVKQVTVNAEVRTPEGQTAPRTLIVTMQKAVGKGADGQERDGRWVITGIRPQGSSAPATN
jgi:hypothetical protein